MKRLSELLQRAQAILQTEGLISFVKRVFDFVLPIFFTSGTYYLYEHPLRELDEARFLPKKTEGLAVRIVSSNEDADVLAAERFDFRSRFVNARRMLDRGAIAICIFIGQDIAHITWVGMTHISKKTFDGLPYKVDFLNKEACTGGTVTLPKYRGLGLMSYGIFTKFQFLRKAGILIVRHATGMDNMASRKPYQKFDYRIYAKARYLKVLCWRFWRETPIALSDHVE